MRLVVLNVVRLLLVFAIASSFFYSRNLIFLMSIVGFFVTFLPSILKFFGIEVPTLFEIILIFFLYGLLVFGGTRTGYLGFWWWDISFNFLAAITLGVVVLTILNVLQKEEIINVSIILLGVATFFFTISLGALWEVFEFVLDTLLGFGFQNGLEDIMKDMIMNIFGALTVSGLGVYLLRSGKGEFMSNFFSRFVVSNFKFLKSKGKLESSSKFIEDLIVKGENERLEFKSTLRKNLHTGKVDKNISHSVLKTIVAYLNSKGGSLLIGISDDGKILGLENDDFANLDRLRLFFTDLLRKHIGSRFLPNVKFEIYSIDGVKVLKVDCFKSSKRVFLNWENSEEFYVRHGASTLKLKGSDLIDYVRERFG